jgi:hypothetical protein
VHLQNSVIKERNLNRILRVISQEEITQQLSLESEVRLSSPAELIMLIRHKMYCFENLAKKSISLRIRYVF